MKSLIASLCLCFLCYSAFSQDLHIHYDVQTEHIKYISDDKVIKRPTVKKGSNIFVHVENYNNYLYEVNIESSGNAFSSALGFNSFSSNGLLPSLGQGFSPLSLLGLSFGGDSQVPFLKLLGMNGGEDDDIMGFGMSDQEEEDETISLFALQINKTLKEIEKTEGALLDISSSIQNIIETQELKAFALEEIEKIKYNPKLNPAQIKKLSEEYMEKIFEVDDVSKIDLNTMLQKNDFRQQLSEKMLRFSSFNFKYNEQLSSLSELKDTLDNFNLSNPSIQDFREELASFFQLSNEKKTSFANHLEEVNKIISTVPKKNIQQLTSLRYEYEVLTTNTFSHTFRSTANGDMVKFKLNFTEVDTSSNVEGKSIRTIPIDVNVHGGFKINASVGISFGQFFDQPKNYFIRDSTIQSEDKDRFVPMLTSFFNFYGQSSGAVSAGGAFGIGLPLTGGTNLQSVSFFMGPSLIMGRGQSIVLTGGIMGSRVERLGQGYQVGDDFISEVDILPTNSIYELGYFLGLSFNLFQ